MSSPSIVLLCAGAAAGLSGLWVLSGMSERSTLRATPRVAAALALGLLGIGAVHFRAPAVLRGELGLPALFGLTSVLALTAGAAKLDAALLDRDGPRAVRRSAGLLVGSFLGIAAVAAVSLELVLTSLGHARWGWAYMLPSLLGLLVVFAGRARLAGAAALSLGSRGILVAAVGVLLIIAARAAVAPRAASALPAAPAPSAVESASMTAPPAVESSTIPASSAPLASPSLQVVPVAPSASASPPEGEASDLRIDALVSRGMLDADARGGVTRRLDRLQACLRDNQSQPGVLTFKVAIDASGSVSDCRATGGDLLGTPLATCLLPVFYKMGFAAPASGDASFDITLRAP